MHSGRKLLVALIFALIAACGGGTPMSGRPPAEVGIVVLAPRRAEINVELPGRTVAFRIAQVRPQITGIIQKRLFVEGASVAAGQPLYQIEPGTYRAARDSARAALSKAEANLQTARLRYERIDKLAGSGLASQQDRDDVTANLQQAQADLGIARAALESAQINLDYTRIVAPIAGRIATSAFTEGALVTANQAAALTTVTQLDPMYVDLSQSSADVLRLQRQIAAGTVRRTPAGATRVQILLEDGSVYPLEGTLEFTGVTVSESTGAITLRAIVPNPKSELMPGTYVRAVVQQAVDEQAILAPQSVVARNENGEPVALVVDKDNRVEQRVLRLGNAIGDEWLVIAGLAAGDHLIVEGRQKVKAGDPVRPVPAGSAAPTGGGTPPASGGAAPAGMGPATPGGTSAR
ncbi:MAG: efflux RND transporter periplasmic adaptor subunit [Gammaproteobacteria bacterium]|nr:efflux RND transporter periplasmic adaptor subunit [Gammaproteobacteria bacterium]